MEHIGTLVQHSELPGSSRVGTYAGSSLRLRAVSPIFTNGLDLRMSKGHCPPCPCFLERLLLKCCQATRSSKPWRSNRPSCGLWSWCQQPHTHGNWPPMDGYRWRRRSSELVSGNLSGCIQASCQSLDCAFTPRWHRTTDGTTDAPPTGAVDEE